MRLPACPAVAAESPGFAGFRCAAGGDHARDAVVSSRWTLLPRCAGVAGGEAGRPSRLGQASATVEVEHAGHHTHDGTAHQARAKAKPQRYGVVRIVVRTCVEPCLKEAVVQRVPNCSRW